MTETTPRRRLLARLAWTFGALAALVGLYALVGFRIAPGIVRDQAIAYVRETHARELAIGEVRLQPFALQLEVKDVSFPDEDGRPMLGFRRLFVDFELSSLWRGAYVFREVALEAPQVAAVIRPGGALNLGDLAPADPAGPPPPAAEARLPSVWIESLAVSDGSVAYEDRSRAQPFAHRFAPVAFSLDDFRTTPDGGDFSLSARSQAGASFEWRGRFALAPQVASEGELTIAALRAPLIAEFLGDALPFGLTSGTVDLAGRYRVRLGDELELKLDVPQVTLAELALHARGTDADWVRIPKLALNGVAVALPEQSVTVGGVAVDGLQADAWIAADGTMNLARLFATPGADAAEGHAGTGPQASADPAGSKSSAAPVDGAGRAPAAPTPWRVNVARVELAGGAVRFEDRRQTPVTPWTLAPLRLRIDDVSLDLGRALPLELTARVNDNANVALRGTLTPEPLAAALEVTLDDARLRLLQPYLLPLADLTIRDGTANAKGRLELRPPGGREPELTFSGDVTLAKFRATDNAANEEFVKFGRVQVQKLQYAMAPDSVRVDRIVVDDPYARVVIGSDAILNVSAVLDPAGTAAALQARRAQEAARARETPAERRQRERVEKAAAAAAEKQRRLAARRGAASPAPVARSVAPETMPIRIREVQVARGRLDFADRNVQPNFAAEIRALGGTISGLSSAPTSRAKLQLAGNVGEFSPVSIEGELQPFMYDSYTDVRLKFANISLPVFNPYSGRFAGYSIAKGKLDTELAYAIRERRLDAKHHVRIDQLEWGDATANQGEATLPVKFATVLLRDRNGVIDLNLPVTGTLDDPKFRIGPIVWQVIRNLIVKAVTAPFALLGSLFAGSEDARFVEFAPGSADLDAAQADRLASLAKALVEKPGLQLDVPIVGMAELDGPALAEQRYLAAREAALRTALRRSADDEAPLPAFDTLDAERRLAVLTAVVQKQTGAPPKLPEPPARPEGMSRADARALREAAALQFLEQAARASVAVGASDLDALAQARGAAVERVLLAGGQLEAQRVFLARNGKASAQDGRVQLELALR
jgi:uncharacterized protein involved in outer membrane biogenesis